MSPEEALQKQIEAYRRMTPEERQQLGFEISEFAREMAREGIRSRYPSATPEEVNRELKRRLMLAHR